MRVAAGVSFLLLLGAESAVRTNSADPSNPIDSFFLSYWESSALRPAPPAGDAEFLRRVTLDLAGRAPTPDEVRAFLASPDRDAAVDRLLASDDYADYWADLWLRLLINYKINDQDPLRVNFPAFRPWLRRVLAEDLPFDELTRALLSATGDNVDDPATNFVLKYVPLSGTPEDLTNRVASVFLGTSIRCAQCHDHPYEPWTRRDYWNFAAFFHQTRPRIRQTFDRLRVGLFDRENRAPMAIPGMDGFTPSPRLPDGRAPNDGETPRQALVRILMEDPSRQFARVGINRIWSYLFGWGFVEPLDGFGSQAQPRHPELLDRLTGWWAQHGYRAKDLLRLLATSDAYRRSSRGADGVDPMSIKPLNIVQITRALVDGLNLRAFLDTAYQQYAGNQDLPEYFRNSDLYRMYVFDYITQLLTSRAQFDEEPRYAGSVRLALRLMNNNDLQNLMRMPGGRLARIFNAHDDPAERIEEVYLTLLSRPPTDGERTRALGFVDADRGRRRAFDDLYWALINSNEFFFVP